MSTAERDVLERMNSKLHAGVSLDPEESGNWLYYMLADMGTAAIDSMATEYAHRLGIMDSFVSLHHDRLQFTPSEYARWRALYASGVAALPASLRDHHRELMEFWESYRSQ